MLLGSDGSQMEGDNAEAARLAVGKQLNVKVLVDDNNVTIAGHPQEYMAGYDLTRTLAGYGLQTETDDGRGPRRAATSICAARSPTRPAARAGHQAADGARHRGRRRQPARARSARRPKTAIKYLEKRGGYEKAIEMLKAAKPDKSPLTYKGSSGVGKNRDDFGKIINEILDGMSEQDRVASVRVFDNDLEGSLRPAPHPQEAPGSVRPRRHHGARQLLRGRRVRLQQGQAGHLRARSARSWRCASARSPWRA